MIAGDAEEVEGPGALALQVGLPVGSLVAHQKREPRERARIMTGVKSGPLPPVFFLGGLLLPIRLALLYTGLGGRAMTSALGAKTQRTQKTPEAIRRLQP